MTASCITETTSQLTSRTKGLPVDGERHYPPYPWMPQGADFAKAWELACQHVAKGYVYPQTMHHSAVISQCYRLACMILAYGLAANRTPLSTPELKPMTKLNSAFDPSEHRVLVVDDLPDVLVSVGAFLMNAGFKVRKAPNGGEALRVIASDRFIDVLIADFAMHDINGADLIGQAIQIRPTLKALIITAYPNADGLTALPAGTTVLAKPFRRATLIAAVKALFQREGGTDPVVTQPEPVGATV